MLSNKDILNAYKRPKTKRPPMYTIKSDTLYDRFMWNVKANIEFVIAPIAPTLVLGIYLKQPALDIAIRGLFVLVAQWVIVFAVSIPSFMGAGVCSNPALSTADYSVIMEAHFVGWLLQIIYVVLIK